MAKVFKNIVKYIFIICHILVLSDVDMIFIIYIFIPVQSNFEPCREKNTTLWNTVWGFFSSPTQIYSLMLFGCSYSKTLNTTVLSLAQIFQKDIKKFFQKPFDANTNEAYNIPRSTRLYRICVYYPSSTILDMISVQKKSPLACKKLVISLQRQAGHT